MRHDRVRRAAAGDRRAFGELYRQHAPMVHGVLFAAVGPGRAADLVQEVFLKALRALPELEKVGSFPGWLRSVARNTARDALRARPRETRASLEAEPPVRDAPHFEAEEVLEALLELPDAYRETLTLRLVEGMSGPEIAARTGLTKGSVRVNLHRGMKRLRARLGIATEEET